MAHKLTLKSPSKRHYKALLSPLARLGRLTLRSSRPKALRYALVTKSMGMISMVGCKKFLTILFFTMTAMLAKPAYAESFYSVSSLKILCGSDSQQAETACIAYLHGIVETWMLKDLVSVDPYRYQSRNPGGSPTFCETINKVSSEEWLRIVRSNLNEMESGFAASAVMAALSERLCN